MNVTEKLTQLRSLRAVAQKMGELYPILNNEFENKDDNDLQRQYGFFLFEIDEEIRRILARKGN